MTINAFASVVYVWFYSCDSHDSLHSDSLVSKYVTNGRNGYWSRKLEQQSVQLIAEDSDRKYGCARSMICWMDPEKVEDDCKPFVGGHS
jgi:hypothetical protein